MIKKICLAKDHHGKACSGVAEEVPRYFCPRCLDFTKILKLYNPRVKVDCPDCGRKLIGSITYICKKCKAIPDMVEIK